MDVLQDKLDSRIHWEAEFDHALLVPSTAVQRVIRANTHRLFPDISAAVLMEVDEIVLLLFPYPLHSLNVPLNLRLPSRSGRFYPN